MHPDAKLLCEKIYKGYWSEKFNKCFILSKKPKLFEDAKSDCANPKGWKLGYPNDAEEKKLMGQIYKHLFKKATEGSEGDIQVEYSSKFFLGFVKSGKICRSIDGKVDLEDNPEFPEAGPACEEDSGNSFGVLDIKNYQFQFSEDDEDDMKHYLCTFDGLEFKTDHYYYWWKTQNLRKTEFIIRMKNNFYIKLFTCTRRVNGKWVSRLWIWGATGQGFPSKCVSPCCRHQFHLEQFSKHDARQTPWHFPPSELEDEPYEK